MFLKFGRGQLLPVGASLVGRLVSNEFNRLPLARTPYEIQEPGQLPGLQLQLQVLPFHFYFGVGCLFGVTLII